MVRKLTPPIVRIAFGMALPLVSSWALADDIESDSTAPAPAVEISEEEPLLSNSSEADTGADYDADSSVADSSVAETSTSRALCLMPLGNLRWRPLPKTPTAKRARRSMRTVISTPTTPRPRSFASAIPAPRSKSSAMSLRMKRATTSITASTRTSTKRAA